MAAPDRYSLPPVRRRLRSNTPYTAVGGKDLLKAPSKAFKAAELVPAVPGTIRSADGLNGFLGCGLENRDGDSLGTIDEEIYP